VSPNRGLWKDSDGDSWLLRFEMSKAGVLETTRTIDAKEDTLPDLELWEISSQQG
jgi:hypothetical protein